MLLTLSDRVESFTQFMTVLLIFAFVVVITYFVTRWVGRYQKTQTTGRNIEVIEATKISSGAFAEVIRVGDRYMAIAVSKDSVTMLGDVNPDSLSFKADDNIIPASFSNVLEKFKNNIPGTSKDTESDGRDE